MECMPGWTRIDQATKATEERATAAQVAWADQELAAGKTNFAIMPLGGLTPAVETFCAW